MASVLGGGAWVGQVQEEGRLQSRSRLGGTASPDWGTASNVLFRAARLLLESARGLEQEQVDSR